MARPAPPFSALLALSMTALASSAALAQSAPEPDWSGSANIGLFSQYVFRGLSQTNEKPAVQGGFDIAHKGGFYAGTWASNISWLEDFGAYISASMEWDFYGGYKGSLPGDFGYDLGVLYYWYPGSYPSGFTSPNTTELYVGLSWKWISFKYSYSAENKTFGFPDSRGSQYLDLSASYDIVEKVSDAIGKVTIFGHVGKQYFRNNGDYDYGDWKVGASTEIYGVTVGIYGTGTNAQDELYTPASTNRNISRNQFVGYVQKTF